MGEAKMLVYVAVINGRRRRRYFFLDWMPGGTTILDLADQLHSLQSRRSDLMDKFVKKFKRDGRRGREKNCRHAMSGHLL